MKPRAEKTARRTGLETRHETSSQFEARNPKSEIRNKFEASSAKVATAAELPKGENDLNGTRFVSSFPCLEHSILFRASIFGFRIFPLVALAFCLLQFPTSARAQATLSSPGIDSLDCITTYDVVEEPTQVCDNSPDPWNGLGETASVTDDDAVIPSGDDNDPPQFTGTTIDELTLRLLGIPSLRQPERSPNNYCLLEHLRERAPPICG